MLNRFCVLIVAVPIASFGAEVETRVNIVPLESASVEFKFPEVPSPSASDAATAAVISIVGGREDSNSGGVAALNDGALPEQDDQPQRNFFFGPSSLGGRLLIALQEPTDVQQINTYSWHPDVRAPQVYRLYGDGGDSQLAVPRRRRTLADSGWVLLAKVDTRSKDAKPGGQVGVSLTGKEGASLGRHGRLLLEIQGTDEENREGQTFFSEIDVVDGKEHEPLPREIESITIQDKYRITFETTETPELKGWVQTKLIPVCITWYPKIVEMFPSDGYTAPTKFTVTFHRGMDGVAYCSGTDIHCAGPWFNQNRETEAVGAVVHEMVHVVQQYGRARGGKPNPGWLVEGVADYVRWSLYEPPEVRTRPNPDRAKYTDSYRVTGAFLAWVVETHGADAVKTLNTAMREGDYSEDLWKTIGGKSLDDLWSDYIDSLRKEANSP
jgi:hypothetical protein